MNTCQSRTFGLGPVHRIGASLVVLAGAAGALGAPIHDAARAGDLAKLEAMVKAHPDLVAAKDESYGQTPLEVAAFAGRKDVVVFLLAHGADVNARAKNGSTALHLAAARGNNEIVELLVAGKADVNALDNDGWSPMRSASYWSHKDTLDLLAGAGGRELPAPPSPPAAARSTPAGKAPPKELRKDGQFTVYDDGTVVDSRTRLMWMGRDNGSALSWPEAKRFAQSYHGAGYSDWRLPTLAELSALYEKDKTRRSFCPSAVNELGAMADDVHAPDSIRLTCTRVWTSDERTDKPGSATVFDFHSGTDAARPEVKEFVDTASRVLVVRVAKGSDQAAGAAPAGQEGRP